MMIKTPESHNPDQDRSGRLGKILHYFIHRPKRGGYEVQDPAEDLAAQGRDENLASPDEEITQPIPHRAEDQSTAPEAADKTTGRSCDHSTQPMSPVSPSQPEDASAVRRSSGATLEPRRDEDDSSFFWSRVDSYSHPPASQQTEEEKEKENRRQSRRSFLLGGATVGIGLTAIALIGKEILDNNGERVDPGPVSRPSPSPTASPSRRTSSPSPTQTETERVTAAERIRRYTQTEAFQRMNSVSYNELGGISERDQNLYLQWIFVQHVDGFRDFMENNVDAPARVKRSLDSLEPFAARRWDSPQTLEDRRSMGIQLAKYLAVQPGVDRQDAAKVRMMMSAANRVDTNERPATGRYAELYNRDWLLRDINYIMSASKGSKPQSVVWFRSTASSELDTADGREGWLCNISMTEKDGTDRYGDLRAMVSEPEEPLGDFDGPVIKHFQYRRVPRDGGVALLRDWEDSRPSSDDSFYLPRCKYMTHDIASANNPYKTNCNQN